MIARDGELWFSPSDLSGYLACRHLSTLALEVARGERKGEDGTSAYAQLIFRKGDEHEKAHLARLRAEGRRVVELGVGDGIERSAQQTAALMREGVDVIYQAPLVAGRWRGIADFLVRVEHPSELGAWGYEAVDTKLARAEMLPHHVLQLCFYSEGIALVQVERPRVAHLELGSGERRTIVLRTVEAYFRRAQQGLERFAGERRFSEPYPCEHCVFCDFRRVCAEWWIAQDHLSRVAGIRRDQSERLAAAGVVTLEQLATLPMEAAAPGLRRETRLVLCDQARLQREAETTNAIPYELLALETGRGFARLPQPSPGDVMFDIEGDPFWTAARELTFLFGLLLREPDGWRYEPVWAHDVEGERAAFERVIDLLVERLERWPQMHVYHYSPAETTVVERLMAVHGTRELQVDELKRREVFCDLHRITRQALRAGVGSYSLKLVEKLAGFERAAEMGSGADAVLGYERWREQRDASQLEAIARYNEEDCRATAALRDWLLTIRPGDAAWKPVVAAKELPPEVVEASGARERLRLELITGEREGSPRWLAGELLEYHRREARPGWWRWYALQAMDVEELIADAEALGGLEPAGAPVDVPTRSSIRWRSRRSSTRSAPVATAIRSPERSTRQAWSTTPTARFGSAARKHLSGEPLPRALIPGPPFDTRPQRLALERLALELRDGGPRLVAVRDVLARALPRLRDRPRGGGVQTDDRVARRALASALDDSYLLVQGPPGAGKTWLGARMIVDLIGAGARVGVTALSHKAINNLLAEVETAAAEEGVTFQGARKTNGTQTRVPDGGQIVNVERNADCLDDRYALVAGTTWLFAPEEMDERLDYLVIDEAGQLSLADALAAGTSARNLILLGDPLQLPQVSQALHPPGTNASVLEHLLGDHATIPEDRGLFLTETWRMHPDVCRFISDEVYDGRLRSAALLHATVDRGGHRHPLPPHRAHRQRLLLGRGGRPHRPRDRAADGPRLYRRPTARPGCSPRPTSWSSRPTTPRCGSCARRFPAASGSAPSTRSRGRRRRSSSSRWRPRAARTCHATSASSSPATASTSRSAAHAASPTSSAHPRCSNPAPVPSTTCSSSRRSAHSSRPQKDTHTRSPPRRRSSCASTATVASASRRSPSSSLSPRPASSRSTPPRSHGSPRAERRTRTFRAAPRSGSATLVGEGVCADADRIARRKRIASPAVSRDRRIVQHGVAGTEPQVQLEPPLLRLARERQAVERIVIVVERHAHLRSLCAHEVPKLVRAHRRGLPSQRAARSSKWPR